MSLILDALKKLEREKDARGPSVLVVGSVPWGTRGRSRRPLVVALAGGGLLALVALALWPRDRAVSPVATPSPSETFPGPAATPGMPSVLPPLAPAPAAALTPPEPRHLSLPSPGVRMSEAPPSEPVPVPDDAPALPPVPPRAGAPGTDELRLNAVSQRDGRRVALINDRLVFEGDAFDGVKVLRIGEAEVEVEVRGRRRVLRF